MADGIAPPPRRSPFAGLVGGVVDGLIGDVDSDPDAGIRLWPRTLDQVQIDMDPAKISGVDLPLPAPGHAISHSGLRIQSLAPNRWMAIATISDDGASDLEARLRVVFEGTGAALVDQSHGRATLRLSGARSRDLLAKGTGIDLHPRSFAQNRVATTALFHVTVTIDRRRGTGTFDLHMPRGYAQTLAERLIESGREYGVRVDPA